MTHRVTLVSPATNPSLRQARFDDGTTSLDNSGALQARSARGSLPSGAGLVTSPSTRCRETAAALGLAVETADAGPAGLDAGRWRGRTLDEVGRDEPEALTQWLADPASAPHGGESVQDLCLRVARWLDTVTESDGLTLAVVEPDVVRAAVVHVLGAPVTAFWRADVRPLTATEISGQGERWNLRLGHTLHP
ncbi:histidine phosphatase family protein [Streptomyces sp. NBC_00285]|uniref:histidine phosphatase family protein n=1 Tax=Streptomyces sp. NBC_00285 TaxID=2975700 RepID=UPI002E2E7D3C|nr:histidine phosphatase family protein [Streptomyces sp. NBC_00285]